MEPKEEESVARRFWNRSLKEIDPAVYTPFVVCLAAGNLEMECFREYISQDIHFLKAYVQALVSMALCFFYFLNVSLFLVS